MAKMTIDTVEYDLPDAVATVVSKKASELEQIKKDNEALKGKLDAMEKLDAKRKMKGKGPSADEDEDEDQDEDEGDEPDGDDKSDKKKDKKKDKAKKDKFSKKDAIEYGRTFAEAETLAKKVIGKEFKSDGIEDVVEIRKQILKKAMPEMKLDGQTEDYVNAAFDVFKASYKDPKARQLQAGVGTARTDSTSDPKQARRDSMQRYQDRWQQPIDRALVAAKTGTND